MATDLPHSPQTAAQQPRALPASTVAVVVLASTFACAGALRLTADPRTQPSVLPSLGPVSGLVIAVVIGAALLFSRYWPWLLLGGGVLNVVPVALPDRGLFWPQLAMPQDVAGLAATPILAVGVLAAAQHLLRRGRTIPGACVGAGVFAAIALDFGVARFAVPTSSSLPPTAAAASATGAAWGLGLLGLLGGVIAVAAWAAGWPLSDADGDPDGTTPVVGRWRVALVGLVAAALPVAVGNRLVFALFDTGDARGPITWVLVTGVIYLLAAVALSAVIGMAALIWTAVVALALTGAGFAVLVSVRVSQLTGEALLVGVLGGLVAGTVLALWRWRPVFAAAGCVAIAVAMDLLYDAVAGDPTSLQRNAERVPNLSLIAVVVATLALVGATAMVSLSRRRAVPVVLLPLVALFAMGAGRLRIRYMLADDGQFTGGVPSDFVGANVFSANLSLGIAAVLLVGVAVLAVVNARRDRSRAAR